MPLFDSVRVQLADHLLNSSGSPAPATWWVGLSTTEPSGDGTGITEPDPSTSYTRVEAPKDTAWTDAVSDEAVVRVTNAVTLNFPTATGSWETIGWFVLFSAETAGTSLAFGELSIPVSVAINDTPSFPSGELRVNFT